MGNKNSVANKSGVSKKKGGALNESDIETIIDIVNTQLINHNLISSSKLQSIPQSSIKHDFFIDDRNSDLTSYMLLKDILYQMCLLENNIDRFIYICMYFDIITPFHEFDKLLVTINALPN